MSRLAECFKRLHGKRAALVPYIVAADPNPKITVGLMHALVEAGADVIELGVPFSDPIADGPVIQAAYERALMHGVMLADVLNMVVEFRRGDSETPVILMGYVNPIEAMGPQRFIERAAQAGVDGLITVDLPPEEAQATGMLDALRNVALDPIFLISPNTSEQRIESICAVACGFLYYVSLKGVTGAAHLDSSEVAQRVEVIRRYTSLPVGVGFGVRDTTSAVAVAAAADAVIIGSALVAALAKCADKGAGGNYHAAVAAFLHPIHAALENMRTAQNGIH